MSRWQDGDTPYVRCGDSEPEPVRLIGIDTPESGFDEHARKRAQWQSEQWSMPVSRVIACGKAATAKAEALCPAGATVQVIGGERDRFDRRLGYVLCGQTNVNLALVESGLAGRYPYPGPPEKPTKCP